jgi:hypothetical protein
MASGKITKKVKLELVGLDGNAFYLMGRFQSQARREGWTPEEIKTVLDDCASGDYNHLLSVLMEHTEPPDPDDNYNAEDADDEEEEEEVKEKPAQLAPTRRPPYQCTYCSTRMSNYTARRAEYEGCPNCGQLNTVEFRP